MATNETNIDSGSTLPSLPATDEQAVMAAISTIRQKLAPFLIDLTPAERKGLSKLGDKSHAFVMKAVDVATQNPGVIPGSHSVNDVQNIANLYQSMVGIRLALQQLYQQIHDSTTKVGSDAYALSRTIYAGTKSPVAGPHLATAADALGKRFGRKSKATADASPAATGPSASNAGSPAVAVPPSSSTHA